METVRFNPQELCSRKLWQLVNTCSSNTSINEINEINDDELSEAIAELAKRRHYLEQLQEIGAFQEQTRV